MVSDKDDYSTKRYRDENGRFLSKEEVEKRRKEPVSKTFIENQTRISSSKSSKEEKLIDLEVNNPLKRITQLLEDIKKQKAFSFTLKGSLGIMGVALTLSVFGVLGGTKLFCDKGVQSHIGVVRVLAYPEVETSDVPFIGPVIDYYKSWFENRYAPDKYRTVMIQNDDKVIYIPYSRYLNTHNITGNEIIATGSYDACSQTLKVKDNGGIDFL